MKKTTHNTAQPYFALKSSNTTRERIILYVFFTIVAILFCHFQIITAGAHHLDSAFLMETLTSIKKTGAPTSYVVESFPDAMNTFTQLAEKLCQSKLIPNMQSTNILELHAYFILYPLALLSWLFPPHIIIAIANGVGFTSIIFMVYWVIRRQEVSALGAMTFCLLVMAHPAWSHASLGDFYADRFFMPLGLLYAILLYDPIFRRNKMSRNELVLLFFVGVLAASTTERGAIMIVLFTVASLVFYKKRIASRGVTCALIAFCMMLLIYLFLYLKLLHTEHVGSAELSIFFQIMLSFFKNLESPVFAAQVKEFLVINVLLFGIFSLFEWRLAVISFITLLPNLLSTIGGAEKTNWGTHYHSMYFPFLVFASAIGFSKLWFSLKKMKYRVILIGVVLVCMLVISRYSLTYGGQKGAISRLYDFYAKGSLSIEKQQATRMQQIAAVVPFGAKVTTLEALMPTLYRDRTIYFYPVGIDVSDYAVLTKETRSDGSYYYTGAVSYLPGEAPKVDLCLNDRLKKAGYNVDHPLLLSKNVAVLERNH